ncbi:MAG TPA: hypothetical protein VJ972_06745 [Anaerolineales bacterium]|nr:hypothetical protein [Anaerolineales bacterium]
MKTIFNVLQDIEKLIYKILMWMVLIPKTIVWIILHPRAASEYVHFELNKGQAKFDEYVSPVILLMVVALLPALGYNILPNFGTAISSPAQTETTTDRYLPFTAQTDLISVSPELDYYTNWEVWKKGADGNYTVEYFEYHPEQDGAGEPEKIDANTIEDRFKYSFDPGDYVIHVSAGDIKKSANNEIHVLEDYEAQIAVSVPVEASKAVEIFSTTEATIGGDASSQNSKFLDQVKDEATIFIALALMIPPLLFAFVTRLFKLQLKWISEDTLKDSFYVQCYYFSPLSLAIWGTFYAYYFFTVDIYWYVPFNTALQILLLPLIWAFLWFIRTEIKRIAWELETPSPEPNKESSDEIRDSKNDELLKELIVKSGITRSIIIVLICFLILGYGVNLLLDFETYMDDLRLNLIRAYPILTIPLIVGFVYSWLKRRKERDERILGRNIAGLAALTVLFFLLMTRVSNQTNLASSPLPDPLPQATEIANSAPTLIPDSMASSTPDVSATQPSVQSSPTLALETQLPSPTLALETPLPSPTATLEPSGFYTDEFNADLYDWVSFFTFGDSRMVKEEIDMGKLSISIRPVEDKFGWYYLVNGVHTYTDVKVETIFTNQGNNTNGVSLICRYSDIGWYEFQISNSGTYKIFVVDNRGIVNQGYNEIANGGSRWINTGRQTNIFSIECKGNELALYVNQQEERRITDNRFLLADGKIGLAVSSPEKLPVVVEFESLTVSSP